MGRLHPFGDLFLSQSGTYARGDEFARNGEPERLYVVLGMRSRVGQQALLQGCKFDHRQSSFIRAQAGSMVRRGIFSALVTLPSSRRS
ncbi:hypothetical protein WL51_18375 [Burkholderia ubonensis]|nr:hypothetical protein WL51_18375 [Burkholderia ubonensis]